MSVTLTADGGDALQEYLSRYRNPHESYPVRVAMNNAGRMVANAAKEKVHVLSGDLQKSIKFSTSKGAKAIAVTVSTDNTRYAGPLEHGHSPSGWDKGTKEILPQPYMWPAFEENKKEAFDLIKEGVRLAMNKP